LSGDGKRKAVATDSIIKAANDVDSWNDKKLRMLKNIPNRMKCKDVSLIRPQAALSEQIILHKWLTLALRNGADNRREVVIGKDYIRGLLGDVGSTHAHRDANVSGLAIYRDVFRNTRGNHLSKE
jgi:hypothetical protein